MDLQTNLFWNEYFLSEENGWRKGEELFSTEEEARNYAISKSRRENSEEKKIIGYRTWQQKREVTEEWL